MNNQHFESIQLNVNKVDVGKVYCSLNNFEATVLQLFQLVFYHNLPSRVKSDMGIKNIDVARFMLDNQGLNRRL